MFSAHLLAGKTGNVGNVGKGDYQGKGGFAGYGKHFPQRKNYLRKYKSILKTQDLTIRFLIKCTGFNV